MVTALGAPAAVGVVLVVSGHDASRTATIGDIMAASFKAAGVVGLITDGLVRDASEIRRLGFPVWRRGTTPTGPNKLVPGRVGGSIEVDGIVVWPEERIDGLLEKADARRRSDEERLAKIREGR